MQDHPFLDEPRPIPEKSPTNRVVQWHVFRDRKSACDFAHGIVLGEGQRIVGGSDTDSIGSLYWVGVEVDDLARWGNLGAINKHAGI